MAIHVFAGPTLSSDEIHALVPRAIAHPPVRGLDLLKLDVAEGDVVVIIDGYYYHVPAVRHKEILDLLIRGVRVVGAASLGALRAAELHQFGMEGVGKIYRLLRSGVIEGDDEVAVVHSSDDGVFRVFSLPLVNLRLQARAARRAGLLSPSSEQALTEAAAALPFQRRERNSIIDAARARGVQTSEIERFFSWMPTSGVDPKHDDAVAALRYVNAGSSAPVKAQRQIVSVPHHSFLQSWKSQAQGAPAGDGTFISDAAALLVYQLHAEDYPEFQRSVVLNLIHNGGSGEHSVESFLVHRGFLSTGGFPGEWKDLLLPEEVDLPQDERLARVLSRTFELSPRLLNTQPLIAELRRLDLLERGREAVAAALRFNRDLERRQPEFNPHRLRKERVVDWYRSRWKAANLEISAMDRGIFGTGQLRERGSVFYICDRETDLLKGLSVTRQPVS